MIEKTALDAALDSIRDERVLYAMIVVVSVAEDGGGLEADAAHCTDIENVAMVLHKLPGEVCATAANLVGLAIGNPVVSQGRVTKSESTYTPPSEN